MLVLSVYDSKAQVYSQPFFSANIATATRMFSAAVADPNTQLSKFPEDYSLHVLGEFDDATGTLQDDVQKINLGLAAQFKEVL